MKITQTNKKRMIKVFIFFFAISAFSSLLIYAFSKNMVYFYTPSQVINKEAPINKFIRIGGMVKIGSFKKFNDSLKVSFKIYDLNKEVNIKYEGILPDLFAEGRGVIVRGLFKDNVFAIFPKQCNWFIWS